MKSNDYEIIYLDRIKDFIDESSPIYEDVLYINREELNYTPAERADIIECLRILNERGNGSEFILNTVADRFAKTGRMNLTGTGLDINSSEDIVALSKALTNRNCETSRIVYVKDNKIVAEISGTMDLPDASAILFNPKKPNSDFDCETSGYFYNDMLKKTNADGCYFVHNHPGENSSIDNEDVAGLALLKKYVKNVLGGIVLAKNNYCIFNVDGDGKITYKTFGDFSDERTLVYKKEDLIPSINDTAVKPNHTYVFFLNARHRHIATTQYDNVEFNDKNVFRRIRNDGKNIGAVYAYLYTDSEEIYFKASAYTKPGNLFVDVILKNDDVYRSSRLHRKGPVYRGEWLGLSDVNKAKVTKL